MPRWGSESEYVDIELLSGDVCAQVTTVAPGLHVTTLVTPCMPQSERDGLVEFFASLERDWRGWDGERHWEADEGEVRLAAWHNASRVWLRAVTRHIRGDASADWTSTVELSIAAGEDLSAFVQELRAELAAIPREVA